MESKFTFGDIVLVKDEKGRFNYVGVIVKSFYNAMKDYHSHEVYVRVYNSISEYKENDIIKYSYDKEKLEY